MTALPRPAHHVLLAAFAAFMVATRYHHFGDALHLPDASMALFFLGGLFLRGHREFLGFMALAVVVDWASIELAGASDFCVTPSYAFLLPAYALLWYGGRAIAARHDASWRAVALATGVALLSASLSFAISNGAFYWLGGRYENPHFAEYVARAWQWGPLFVRTTMVYIVVALVVHAVATRTLRARSARQATHS